MNGQNAIWYAQGIDNSGLQQGRNEAKKIWGQMEKDASGSGDQIQKIWDKAGKAIGITVSAATIASFARSVVQIRAQRQELEASFEVLLKSGSKAKSMLSELQDLATKSPLEMSHVAGAAQTLLGYGLEAEKVTGILRQLSDVSMGSADKFNSLALAYAQVQSTGKLMGQDLMQMINAGFNPLSVLAEKTGKSIGELKEQMSKGAISAQDVADAFAIATSEGGKFYGMTEKQAEGITGQIASLEDAIANMFNEIGKSSEGVIGTALQGATSLVENYEKVGNILVGLIATYGAYRAAVMVLSVVKAHDIALDYAKLVVTGKLNAAMKALNLTMLKNPLVLIITLVVGLVAATWALRDSTTAEERARKKLNDELEVSKEKKNGLISKGNELIRIIRSETETMYAQLKALKELKKEFPEIFAAMTLEDVKNMPVPELEAKINVVLDERELQEAKDKVSNIQREIEALNREIEEIINNPGKVGATWDRDASTVIADIKKKIGNLNDDLKVSQEYLDNIVKLRKEAEFEAKPTGEKLAYYQQELDALIAQRDELEKILPATDKVANSVERISSTANKATNAWAKFDLQTIRNRETLKFLNKKINEIGGKITGLTGKDMPTYGEAYDTAKKEWEKTKKILSDIEKDKKKFTQKQYSDAVEAEKNAKTAFENLGGVTSGKPAQEALKAQEELSKLILKNDISLQESRLSVMKEGMAKRLKELELERDKNLQAIDDEEKALEKARKDAGKGPLTESEKQGFTERRENVNTVFNNEKVEVEKSYAKQIGDLYRQIGDVFLTEEQRKQAAIKDTYDKLREEAERQFKGGSFGDVGTDEAKAVYKAMLEQIKASETQAELKDALEEYQTYEDKRKAITDKYDGPDGIIQKLIDAGYAARAKEAQKQRDKDIADLDASSDKQASLWIRLFSDTSNASTKTIKSVIADTKKLIDYLNGVSDIKPIGFTEEQLNALDNSEQIKNIYNELIAKQNELEERHNYAFSSIIKGFGKLKMSADLTAKAFKSVSDKEKEALTLDAEVAKRKGLQYMADGAVELTDWLSSAVESLKELAEISGDSRLADFADQMGSLAQNLKAAGQGAQSGGWIGAVVGGVSDMISQTIDAFVSYKAYEEEFEQSMRDFKREIGIIDLNNIVQSDPGTFRYAIENTKKAREALRQYNEELSKTTDPKRVEEYSNLGTAIFSGFGIGLGKKATSESKTLMEAFEKGYTDLEAMAIKTKKQSGWAKFWGKQDKYVSLKDLAPELWDDGVFNTEKAQAFLDTNGQISDEQRAQIQNVVDLKNTYDEAMDAIAQDVENTFGFLGDEIRNALVDAIKNGTDAWSSFRDAGVQAFEKIGEQLAYELFFYDSFEKLKKDLASVYEEENDPEKIAERQANLLEKYFDSLGSSFDLAEEFMSDWQEQFGGWAPDGEERSASEKGIAQASQDSVDELNGRFTAVQGHTYEINESIKASIPIWHNLNEKVSMIAEDWRNFQGQQAETLRHLAGIHDNTDYMRSDMQYMRSDLNAMRSAIENINDRGVIIQR